MEFGPHLLLAILEGAVGASVLALTAVGLGLVFGVIALIVGVYQLLASPNLQFAKEVPGAPIAQATPCSCRALGPHLHQARQEEERLLWEFQTDTPARAVAPAVGPPQETDVTGRPCSWRALPCRASVTVCCKGEEAHGALEGPGTSE